MDKRTMKKATFSQICKMLNGKEREVVECFSGILKVALLFFPGFMSGEIASITRLAEGVTLIDAKQIIGEPTKKILDLFGKKSKSDFTTNYEQARLAHTMLVFAAYFDSMKMYLPDENRVIHLSPKEKLYLAEESLQQYIELLKQKASESEHEIVEYDILNLEYVDDIENYYKKLEKFYISLNNEFIAFYERLFFWEKMKEEQRKAFVAVIRKLPEISVENYKRQYNELRIRYEAFRIWSDEQERNALNRKVDLVGNQIQQGLDTVLEHIKKQDGVAQKNKHRILTEKAPLPPKQYYGRQKEFDNILNKMKTQTKFVLVNGMGGLGKSTLARKLYHFFLEHSQRTLIWISYNGSNLRDDFTKQMLYPSSHNEKEVLGFLFNELDKDAIIFIDNLNVTEAEDPFISQLGSMDCYVICTSRVDKISCFEEVKIDFFNEEESIKLFASYYTREYDYNLIQEIVFRAKYHTLVIEVIAKIGMSERMSLREIVGELENKEFNLSGVAEINLDEKTLIGHLCKLFSTESLTYQQKNLLANMAVFDLYYIPNEFAKWIKLSNRTNLNYLESHAWISRLETGYYMHPLINEVVKRLCNISYLEIQRLVRGMAEFFKYHPAKCASDFMPFFPYAQSIVKRFCGVCTREMIALLYNISIIYWQVGNYADAEKNVKDAIRNAEKIKMFPEKDMAEYINHHGVICHSQKKARRAIRLYKRALEMREHIGGKLDIAQTLSNIALEYQFLFEDEKDYAFLEESIYYQEKSNELFEQIFSKINLEHPNMASAYNNTGRLYYIQGNYEKAIHYFNEAKRIREKKLPKMHEELEITYHFLGCVYLDYAQVQEDERITFLKHAEEYFKKSLKIRTYNYQNGIKKYDPKEVQKKLNKVLEFL